MRFKNILEIMAKPLTTIVVALIIGVFLIIPTGTSPIKAYSVLFFGAFGNMNNFFETLARATPLLFTGLAAAYAFRGGVFNIGTEGQMYLGAMGAALVGIYGAGLPWYILQPLAIVGAMVAAGIWAFIPGYMNSKFGVNIVISTIMMNNIAILFTAYLVTYPFKGDIPSSASYKIVPAAQLWRFTDRSVLNIGFVLAIGLAIVLYLLIFKTVSGYELRAMGHNPSFAKYIGINPSSNIIKILIISGMIAGMAGVEQVLGVNYRFFSGFSPGYAFTGFTVALLGRLHPIGVILGSIFFGALTAGSLKMEALTTVSRDLINSLQGIIILLLAAELLIKIKFKNKKEKEVTK